MMMFKSIIISLMFLATVQLRVAVSQKAQEYKATVTAYPENGPFRSHQLVPLQCTITPTPPIPVMYMWRSSTANHYPNGIFPSSTPITTITINENHPLYGRYYCHVLSASNRTTLAVGHVVIHVTGLLRPTGTTELKFTPPSPLQFMVEFSSEEYSERRLFSSFSDITYEWHHNDSAVSDQISEEIVEGVPTIGSNRLVIPQTSSRSTGTYSAQIHSFGFANYANGTCAMIVLQALKNYAVFQPMEFHAINGNVTNTSSLQGLALPRKDIHVSFTREEPVAVNVKIPLTPIGAVDFSQKSHKSLLGLKVFYNGEKLRPGIFTEVKRPREYYSDFILLTEERAIQATLTLPYPVSDDEGLYELQLFLSLNNINLGFSSNCSDYLDFLHSSSGLKLSTILVGSATLMLHHYGVPQVVVTATRQVLSAGGMESLPILTCSAMEDRGLDLLSELKWVKGGNELAITQQSGTLAFDTANLNTIIPGESHFGTYLCEAMGHQDKVEESIHIAERARFSMQLQSLNEISCHDMSEDVKQSLLNMLRLELEFSLSTAGDGDISSDNFANASLNCSSEGRDIVLMSVDTIYSNRNGTVTASALVEMAEEWMNGIRTANGVTFQINRSGANNSNFTLSAGQLVAIIILCFISVALFIAITILITCIILRYRKRSKKQGLPQEYEVPPNTESTMTHSSVAVANPGSLQSNTSDPINTPLGGQSSATSTTDWERELPLGSQPDSQTPRLHYGSPSIHNEARLLINAETPITSEVGAFDSSLTCTPNCAYNGMHEMGLRNQTRDPIASSRQISVQYDYPVLRFTADHSNKDLELSDNYDVITSVKPKSYFTSKK